VIDRAAFPTSKALLADKKRRRGFVIVSPSGCTAKAGQHRKKKYL
jgi:hypothetical protein